MPPKSVYIETSIASYLTARPSRDLHASSRRITTENWWKSQRPRFDLYVSDVVMDEAARGDREAAARRIDVLVRLPILVITSDVRRLSKALLDEGGLPAKAVEDSMHVAVSSVHGMDYLLTWNCRHIDNAEMKPHIRAICAAFGFACPEICTPEELMGEGENG